MDVEQEFEEFKKSNQPSLIGVTIRNDHAEGETPEPDLDSDATSDFKSAIGSNGGSRSVSASRSASGARVFKKSSSLMQQLDASIADLKFEGALLNDDEGEALDTVLDDEGHLKDNALQVQEKAKLESEASTNSGSDVKKSESPEPTAPEDARKVQIFGGDAGNYIAPASGMGSSYALVSPSIAKTMEMEEKNFELFKPEEIPTLDDVIQKVNNGEKVEEPFDEERKTNDSKSSISVIPMSESDPQIPDSAIENDSEFIAPASARDGSKSRYLSSSRHDFSPSPLSHVISTKSQPHLARGDSYHSGLSQSDYSSDAGLDASLERRPRHEPGTGRHSSHITNPSSLNYLRNISRSRSRVANDVNAIGYDRGQDKEELEEEGALMGDPYTQDRDLEEALSQALETKPKTASSLSKEVDEHLTDIKEDDGVEEDDKNEGKEDEVKGKDEVEAPTTAETEVEPELPSANTEVDDQTDENADALAEKIVGSVEDAKSEAKEETVSDESEQKSELHAAEELAPETSEIVEPEVPVTEAAETEEVEAQTPKAEGEIQESEPDAEDQPATTKEEAKEITTEPVEIEDNAVDKAIAEEEVIDDLQVPQESAVCDTVESGDLDNEAVEAVCEEPKEVLLESSEEPMAQEEEEEKEEEEKEEVEEQPEAQATEEVVESKEVEAEPEPEVEAEPEPEVGAEPEPEVVAEPKTKELDTSVETKPKSGADGSVYVPKEAKMTFEDEPVYIYTSLAGGFQVMSRTNRIITILTANKIPYECKDLGTDEEAKKVWRRYSGGKPLPGIVRGADDFIGNFADIEEANENYELRSLIYETY